MVLAKEVAEAAEAEQEEMEGVGEVVQVGDEPGFEERQLYTGPSRPTATSVVELKFLKWLLKNGCKFWIAII